MTGLVRNAAITAACMLVAGVALAGVPSASTSHIYPSNGTLWNVAGAPATPRINVGGFAGGSADSVSFGNRIHVVVNDLGGLAVAGSNVVLDFSGCTSDSKVASAQLYHGETVGCAGATVSNYTTATGDVYFVVIGGGTRGAIHGANCAKVYADGVLLGSIGVGQYDQGNPLPGGGITTADIGYMWNDYFNNPTADRSDIDGNGNVTTADVGYGWNVYFSPRETASAATYCP